MADCYLWIGSDLLTTPTGDIMVVDGITEGTQRVLRRLITALGSYKWHVAPTDPYGAGLPKEIGRKRNDNRINSIITSQIFLEACVSRKPAPVITLADVLNGVNVTIVYTDTFTGEPTRLSFDLTGPSQ